MNLGTMKSLQSDPDNPDGNCITTTQETNTLLAAMFNPDNYSTGEITQAEFLENFQIMSYTGMEQLENCGGNDLLIKFDTATNKIQNFIAGSGNFATQIGIGLENRDQAIFYAIDELRASGGAQASSADWEKRGKGLGLLVSQFIKFEAPDAVVEVSPTSA